MNFYESISKYYEHIFPYNPVHKEFVLNSLKSTELIHFLDIGCGTGELAIHLSENCKKVDAIDLNSGMLQKAKSKIKNQENIHFQEMNMLELEKYFPKDTLNIISCFGNTLVHLKDALEASQFFNQAHSVLIAKGKLLFQIINYDRIIDQKIDKLATIENDFIKFERNYTLSSNYSHVDFETILSIKADNTELKNSITLLALRKKSIDLMLKKSGFESIRYYGNFKRLPYNSESIPLIVEAVKA